MITKAKHSEKILVKVYSVEEDALTSRFAIIELSEELINKIKTMKEQLDIVKSNLEGKSIYQLNAFDFRCEFIEEENFDEEEIEDEVLETLFLSEVSRVNFPKSEEIPLIRDDVKLLHVSEFGFKFSAYIKNTSIRLDTATVNFAFLDITNDVEKVLYKEFE